MRELLLDLVDAAARHADYADARHVVMRRERLATRNGALDELHAEDSEGVGIRVRLGGAWGFAAVRGSAREDCEAALARALAVARRTAGGAQARRSRRSRPRAGSGRARRSCDPFAVPLEGKLAALFEADAALRAGARLAVAVAHFEARSIRRARSPRARARCASST